MTAIGVLALQGNVPDHVRSLQSLGVETRKVRRGLDLDGLDGLVIPGGESTVIRKLLVEYDLEPSLLEFLQAGRPVFGTCAGAILLGTVPGAGEGLGLVDVQIERNAYGRQNESFITDLEPGGVGGGPLPGVFIRAPRIRAVGNEVETLVSLEGEPVLVRQTGADRTQALLATFHPELTDDTRVHRVFLDLVG